MSDSVSLKISLLGVSFLVIGYFIQFVDVAWTTTGVWSAILAIWGVALFLLGLVSYATIWWSYR